MSIYGEQWVCLCGWHNVFLRRNCRNCNGPSELATTRTESVGDVLRQFQNTDITEATTAKDKENE